MCSEVCEDLGGSKTQIELRHLCAKVAKSIENDGIYPNIQKIANYTLKTYSCFFWKRAQLLLFFDIVQGKDELDDLNPSCNRFSFQSRPTGRNSS